MKENIEKLKRAQRIGKWYAVLASIFGTFFFLMTVEAIGVVIMQYDPVYLLVDLIYIYRYAFCISCSSALLLSYFAGRKAAKQIVLNNIDPVRVGISSALNVFAISVAIGIVVLGIFVHEHYYFMMNSVLANLIITFLVIFSIGYIPIKIVGFSYGKIMKRQVST